MNTSDKNTAYELVKNFNAPPEKVFGAFLDEAMLKKYGANQKSKLTFDQKDASSVIRSWNSFS